MAPLRLRVHPDPVLRAKALPVGGPPPPELIAGMRDLLEEHEGLGLAGPQVGEGSRVILARDDDGTVHALVDPVLSPVVEAGRERDWEGCLSLPGLAALVPRFVAVEVAATDEEGRPVRFVAEGLFARVVQHECDHLDGVLIFDRASPDGLTFEDEPITPEQVAECFPG